MYFQVLSAACQALRVLTFDDDVRVPFGKAHEHAKMIVTEENAPKKILDICHGKYFCSSYGVSLEKYTWCI